MILNALVETLKRRAKDDFKGHCHNQVCPTDTRSCYARHNAHTSHVLNIKGRSYRLRNLEDALKLSHA